MNFFIFIFNVLDPQDKYDYLKFSINTIYGNLIGGSLLDNVKSGMFELYNDYVLEGPSVNENAAPTNAFNVTGRSQETTYSVQSSMKSTSVLKDRFK